MKCYNPLRTIANTSSSKATTHKNYEKSQRSVRVLTSISMQCFNDKLTVSVEPALFRRQNQHTMYARSASGCSGTVRPETIPSRQTSAPTAAHLGMGSGSRGAAGGPHGKQTHVQRPHPPYYSNCQQVIAGINLRHLNSCDSRLKRRLRYKQRGKAHLYDPNVVPIYIHTNNYSAWVN